MADLVFIALTAAFFAVCVAYISLCDRILGPDDETPLIVDDQPKQGAQR